MTRGKESFYSCDYCYHTVYEENGDYILIEAPSAYKEDSGCRVCKACLKKALDKVLKNHD
jgi:hypothetical protein